MYHQGISLPPKKGNKEYNPTDVNNCTFLASWLKIMIGMEVYT